MNKKESVLTLKLDSIKTEELEIIKKYINCKTSAGAIKHMIDRYILLENEVIRLRNELSGAESDKRDIENATHVFF